MKAPIRLVAITQMRTRLDRGVEHFVALQALPRTAPGFSYLLRKGIADRCPPLHVPSSTQLGLQINWQSPESKTRHKVLEHPARLEVPKLQDRANVAACHGDEHHALSWIALRSSDENGL